MAVDVYVKSAEKVLVFVSLGKVHFAKWLTIMDDPLMF